jgi:predicted Zn-ribbon and HTH transcriptional regulator
MAREEREGPVAVDLPADLAAWLDEEAAVRGEDRETVLRELLAAHRDVTSADTAVMTASDEVDDRLESQREEYVDLVEDVRQRVVQVKHETDRKATADRADALEDAVSDVHEDVDDLHTTVERLRADLDSGFQNYETVLRYLKDTTEETQDGLDTVAEAVADLRSQVVDVVEATGVRQETDRLKRAANQLDVRKADCEACEAAVDVALLTDPSCPHCSAGFVDVEPSSGFFGTATLETGDAPALAGDVATRDGPETDAIATDGEGVGPPVDMGTNGGDRS